MNNNFAKIIKQQKMESYRKGHQDGCLAVMQLAQMGFCIAMNDEMGIGAERFEKIRKRAMKIIGTDFVNDAELTRHRMEERYIQITGHKIEESVTKERIK